MTERWTHRMVLIGALALTGCGTGQTDTASMVGTIQPVSAVLAEVVPEATVTTLLPRGVSPHAYEPLPSAVVAASRAGLLVAFDPEIDGWVTSMATSRLVWMNQPGADPHGWLDPLIVRDALPRLVEEICSTFSAWCPAARRRADSLQVVYTNLASEQRLQGMRVVISSNFLTAFSSRFGLEVLDILAPVEGVDPSPAAMGAAIRAAEEADLVVGQFGFPELAAREVAKSAGKPFVLIDPIGSRTGPGGYSALIEDALQALVDSRE